jgi:hypothetical protein
MGKGSNVAKANAARARNAAQADKPGGGGQEGMKARIGGQQKMKCSICLAEVICNSKVQLAAHHESKHSKETFEKCWPDWSSD